LIEKSFKNKRVEDVNKNREYQRWALSQLKLVKTFDDILKNELDKVPGVVDRNNPLSKSYRDAEERAFTALDKIMIVYMAPINPVLLDEAVATWYRKVFKDRFDKLNDAHKLKVVEGFAEAEKRLIEQ
jgi:hypothetical protein